MTESKSVGSIDERGYLNSFYREGFTDAKCLLELIANSLDSLDKLHSGNRNIIADVQRDKILLIDDGVGMTEDQLINMFAIHRENHENESTRGVSGVGAKPATCILSEKKKVMIFTRKPNGSYLRAEVPWDKIFEKGIYSGMIKIGPMTQIEKEEYMKDRSRFGVEMHGTTIQFPNNDNLSKIIKDNFSPAIDNDLCNPQDRIDTVFGRDNVIYRYKHYESKEIKSMYLYNYFHGSAAEFYTGKSEDTIEHWYSEENKKDRFIWKPNEISLEIVSRGKGFSLEPDNQTEGLQKYKKVGTYQVTCGLRFDEEIFDPSNPVLLTATKNNGKYNNIFIHPDEMNKFLSSNKLVRNNQCVGLIPPPEVSVGNSRANGHSYLEILLVQCEVAYSPVSNQTNHQDRVAQIQKNKNQHDGSTIPKNLTRLIKAIKKKKSQEIWKYMEDLVNAQQPLVEEEEEEIALVQTSNDETVEVAETVEVVEEVAEEVAETLEVAETVEVVEEENEPTPIDVSPHRKGCVKGEEFIEMIDSFRNKIQNERAFTDPLSIEIFNKLKQWASMKLYIE